MSYYVVPPDQRGDVQDDGMTLYLKVNYKVLLLVVVVFDILHVSIDEVVAHAARTIF